jgi:hypothetical protein
VLRESMLTSVVPGGGIPAAARSLGLVGECVKTFTDEIAVGEWVACGGVLRRVINRRPRLGGCEVTLEFEPLDGHAASVLLVMFERVEVWREPVVHADLADAAAAGGGSGVELARPVRVRVFTDQLVRDDVVRYQGRLRRVVAVYAREAFQEVSLDLEPVEGAEDRVHLRVGVLVSVWRTGGAA